jgi:hypothetical protein
MSNEDIENYKPSEQEVMDGGRMVTVRSATGEEEAVLIRLIPRRLMEIYVQQYGKEASEAYLYTDKSNDWLEKLDDNSFDAVLRVGRKINFSRWRASVERSKDQLQQMGNTQAVRALMAQFLTNSQAAGSGNAPGKTGAEIPVTPKPSNT